MNKKEVIVPANDLVCLGKDKLHELIRCKDCKWYKRDHNGGCLCETGGGLYNSQPEDYCSRAERRKDDRRQNNTV